MTFSSNLMVVNCLIRDRLRFPLFRDDQLLFFDNHVPSNVLYGIMCHVLEKIRRVKQNCSVRVVAIIVDLVQNDVGRDGFEKSLFCPNRLETVVPV